MLNLADAMFENKISELVLASSSEVYQQPDVIPTPEKVSMVVPELENPRYSYGLGKIVQEFYSFHAMKHLERLIIFRPHNIYGPNMGSLHVVPQLIEKCKQSMETAGTLLIEGDGLQTRSFCFINDFVDAFELIYMKGQHKNVYNIGTSDEINIKELAQKIAQLTGHRGSIETSTGPNGGTSRRLPDIKKITQLGFIPKISLEEGLSICLKENNEV
jgi:nucleoside-diphosphate-sugar epimerase